MKKTFSTFKENKIIQTVFGVSREILMIIVGILLALKIDTYVSERAEVKSLKSNLHYVLEDINNNTAALKTTKEQKAESIRACTELIDNFKLEKSMHSEDLVKTLSSILKTNKFVVDQSGFERIKSSPLYESDDFFEVRDKIRQYNLLLEDLRFAENFINSYISSLSMEMSKNGSLLVVFDYIRMHQNIAQYDAEVPHFEVDEILSTNKPLQAVLHKYEFDAPKLIQLYTDLDDTGAELRQVIDEFLAG